MIWSLNSLRRIDLRVIPVILALMGISLLVIASQAPPKALVQLKWFGMGAVVYVAFAGLDYAKLRESTWILYALMLLALVGLFSPVLR